MVIHFSKQVSPLDVQDLIECAEFCLVGGGSMMNITFDLDEVAMHWQWFERIVFIANLLEVNGVFVLGNLMSDIESHEIHDKIKDLYSNTIFSNSEIICYPADQKEDYAYPKRVKREVLNTQQVETTDKIRCIVIWEGTGVLRSSRTLHLQCTDGTSEASVIQVQKIINPDFSGSKFGVKEVEKGEIATITLQLEAEIEHHLYHEVTGKGFVIIRDKRKDEIMGYGIIIKE